jgi:hypothetical protein
MPCELICPESRWIDRRVGLQDPELQGQLSLSSSTSDGDILPEELSIKNRELMFVDLACLPVNCPFSRCMPRR